MFKYGCFSYSLDKIKIKGHILRPNFVLRDLFKMSNVSSWVNFHLPSWILVTSEKVLYQAFKYRYSYSLLAKDSTEGVFYISEFYNGDFRDQASDSTAFIIEFNPNKEGRLIYKKFLQTFVTEFNSIISFDIAYDLPGYTVNDVFLDTKCDVMSYGSLINRTYYIAPKENKCGRIKIYNKHIERACSNVKIDDTLRIECSFKCKGLDFNTINLFGSISDELTKACNHLNSVYIRSRDKPLSWELLALSYLSEEQLLNVLSCMSRPTRLRYKKSLKESSTFNLSLDVITLLSHIEQLLKPYIERIKIK